MQYTGTFSASTAPRLHKIERAQMPVCRVISDNIIELIRADGMNCMDLAEKMQLSILDIDNLIDKMQLDKDDLQEDTQHPYHIYV